VKDSASNGDKKEEKKAVELLLGKNGAIKANQSHE